MPTFPIKWSWPITYIENRPVILAPLNDELILVCVLYQNRTVISSIRIQRRDTAGTFSVSGQLIIKIFGSAVFEKRFSQFFITGSSFTEIFSVVNVTIGCNHSLDGYVGILRINETQPNRLANVESKETIQLKSLQELSKDFEHLLYLASVYFADVTLKCGDVSFPAHKIILSARSPVFEAMFRTPMKESRKNEVEIIDIDESTLLALLIYLYTGKTSDLTVSLAADLYFGADKYQLQDLKAVCSYFLKKAVSVENVWRILVLGELHSEDLKSFAVDYICNNCGEFSVIEKTEEWKALRKVRPGLAMGVLESLVKYREEKQKR